MTDFQSQSNNQQSRSDQELIELFRKAESTHSELRLLRIGGPLEFRNAIISSAADKDSTADSFVSVLLSPEIPLIKVLFADPDGDPFLNRLDHEVASCWKIWRVRKQLLQLAQSMLFIGANRKVPDSLLVGFHRDDLIWNLGIVGQDNALVRPYGKGTGHDESVVAHRFISDRADDLLARSFYNYFESLSTRPETSWIRPETLDLEAKPRWPSLYKGNAILARESDIDGTAEPEVGSDEVCKICFDTRSNDAEERWLGLSEPLRTEQVSFRPGTVIRQLDDYRGQGIIVGRIPGPSLFELATYLNSSLIDEDSLANAGVVLNLLLEDSLLALNEFRILANHVLPREKRVTYPYKAKLVSAITEIRKHLLTIPERVWNEAIEDATELGDELEQLAQVPFRDAHLKNRLWNESRSVEEIAHSLLFMSTDDVRDQLHMHVRDIDFETAYFNVTQWDDPFHILMFENSTLGHRSLDTHSIDIWNEYCASWSVTGDLSGWRTGLARATRELARRFWYSKVMPNEYIERYSKETPDFFLRLALECSSRSRDYLKLRRLLEKLEAQFNLGGLVTTQYDRSTRRPRSSEVSGSLEVNQMQRLSLRFPDITVNSLNPLESQGRALRAFISYSHKDEQHRENLDRTLKLVKRDGLLETWSDDNLVAGKDLDEKILKELESADIIIFLVSYDLLASDYCYDIELQRALERRKNGTATVLPIIVRPVLRRYTPFFDILALPKDGKAITTWQNEDEAWVNVELGVREVCSQLSKEILISKER